MDRPLKQAKTHGGLLLAANGKVMNGLARELSSHRRIGSSASLFIPKFRDPIQIDGN